MICLERQDLYSVEVTLTRLGEQVVGGEFKVLNSRDGTDKASAPDGQQKGSAMGREQGQRGQKSHLWQGSCVPSQASQVFSRGSYEFLKDEQKGSNTQKGRAR